MYNELFEWVLREAKEIDKTSEILEEIKIRIENKLIEMAVEMEFVPFNMENYNNLLGNGVNSPCGYIEFGENQFLKLKGKDNGGRQNLIWAIRQTIEDPIVIIHNDIPGPKLHRSLTYAKSFIYQDSSKHRDSVNTIRSFILLFNEDNKKISISSGQARIDQILKIIKKPDDVIYEKK